MNESGLQCLDMIDHHERYTRLLIQHEPQLLRGIMVMVPNRSDARDILQEVSVVLWRHFDKYDVTRPFTNWAMGYVRIEVRRFLRKNHQRTQLSDRAAELLYLQEQQEAVEIDERLSHLKHCLTALPQLWRDLLEGYYFKEQTVQTLSEQQGRTVEAIYKRLQRVRLSLHKCIQSKMKEATL